MTVTPLHIVETMTKRRDFLAAARAKRAHSVGFVLQARYRSDDEPLIRVGFTASKKVGNAVARNRAKRRMRALARAVLPLHGTPGWDYVLIGRANATATIPMTQMITDCTKALRKLHS